MSQQHHGSRPDDDISQMLRGALGDTDFDYDSLVAGAHQRAGRIRRRRAIATGVAVAVLGPALVGGAALVVPDLLSQDGNVVGPAATTDVAVETTQAPSQDDTEESTATPPWQDGEPPMPAGGPEPDNEDFPNAWEIPDARPTGVDALDDLDPQLFMDYPRTAPVDGLMACDPGNPGGVEPLAGQSATYYVEEGSDRSIGITVTGWADSTAARDGLVNGDYTSCAWESAVGDAEPWPGQEGDEDRLVFSGADEGVAAAVVRQGDYLVSVTVHAEGQDEAVETATEIAGKQAENLEALDPEHGRD